MKIHRMIFGLKFNRKIFRIPNISGEIIDEVLSLKINEKRGRQLFSIVEQGFSSGNSETLFTLASEGRNHIFSFSSEQVIYKRTATEKSAAIGFETTMDEFAQIWVAANKVARFPEVRRIGVVAELRGASNEKRAPECLLHNLTDLPLSGFSNRFQLAYSDVLTTNRDSINYEKDEYEVVHKNFYNSDLDETPEEGKINANIDYQKYYNPAKLDGLSELQKLKKRFTDEKEKFQKLLETLGLEV